MQLVVDTKTNKPSLTLDSRHLGHDQQEFLRDMINQLNAPGQKAFITDSGAVKLTGDAMPRHTSDDDEKGALVGKIGQLLRYMEHGIQISGAGLHNTYNKEIDIQAKAHY